MISDAWTVTAAARMPPPDEPQRLETLVQENQTRTDIRMTPESAANAMTAGHTAALQVDAAAGA
jgi:hypothetical protein